MTVGVAARELIGRERELDDLDSALVSARGGSPRIVVIAGEAGVGKTRLVSEALQRARAAETAVLSGGCLDLAGAELPYAPLVEALRGLTRTMSSDELASVLGPARDELTRLLPSVSPAGTGRAEGDAGSGLAQARLFELVLSVLGRLGAVDAVVFVVEDIHWIDRATRDLVTFLARNLSDEHVLLVLTARTDELWAGHPVTAWLSELERSVRTARLELDRLSADEVERLLGGILGERPDAALVRRIFERSGGNPFFVEELAAAERAGGRGPLPRTLAETLLVQLTPLSAAAHRLLGAVAVAGRPVDERLLAAALGLTEDDVRPPLREAIAQGVLVAEPVNGALTPRHALLREIVESELLPAERRELHAQFAAVLASRPELAEPSPALAAAELARHWTAADRPDEAYAAWIAAAGAAEAVYAHAAALGHYERAIALEDRATTAGDPVELRRMAAVAAHHAAEVERALALVEDAIGQADLVAGAARAGTLHSFRGYLLWVLERNDDALAAHRLAVELVPASPPTSERARVLTGFAAWLMSSARYAESRSICEEAIACASAAGERIEEGRARNMLGCDLVALGAVDEGLLELERARAMAADEGPVDAYLSASHNLAYNLLIADRYDEAIAAATDGFETAARYDLDRRFGPHLRATAIDAEFRVGRWSDAKTLLESSLASHPSGYPTIYRDAAGARLYAARGELGAARERLAAAAEHTAGEVDADLVAYVELAAAELALSADDPAAAGRSASAGLAALAATDDTVLSGPLAVAGMRAAADRGERARARRRPEGLDDLEREADAYRAAMAVAEPDGSMPGAGSRQAIRAMFAAEAARLEDRREPGAWADAAAAWEALPSPYPAAYCRFREAESWLVSGGRTEGEAALRRAWATASGLGAGPLMAAIDALARRARLTLAEAPSAPTADDAAVAVPDRPVDLGLSPRELEVLGLVAAGRTNGQIARELFITTKTAGVHVTHILDKLGVNNRVEAAMVAARAGILSVPEDDGGSERA
ncbi:MAG: AAA family ATPase [Chloroflexota bacterium]